MRMNTRWITSALAGAVCLAQAVRGADPLDNWTTKPPAPQNLYSLTFGNGMFVGIGGSGGSALISSRDLVDWNQFGTGQGIQVLTWGGGQFAAMGSGGGAFTSPDGVNWTQHNTGPTNATLLALTYGDGRFVAAGRVFTATPTPATLFSSPDGISWTSWYWTNVAGYNNPVLFNGVAYGNGHFVAVGTGSDLFTASEATSPDGVNWTQLINVGPGPTVNNAQGYEIARPGVPNATGPFMTFGGGLFVAVGGNNYNSPGGTHALLWTSPDGLKWSVPVNYASGDPPGFAAVAAGAGQFVASGTTLDPSGVGKAAIWTSSDGTNWITRDLAVPPTALTFGSGLFVGSTGNNLMQSGVIGKLGASLSPASGLQGTITGVTGQTYAIESSTNLTAWGQLTSITINTNGIAKFSDPAATSLARRFYAAHLAQQ